MADSNIKILTFGMTFKRAVFIILLAEWLIILLGVWNYGPTLQGLQAITRFSGRFSLFLFSLIFLFSRNERLNVRMILSEQFYFIFALAHGIHLMELLSYVYLSDTRLIPIRVLGGFVAYAVLFAMPILQYFQSKGKVSLKLFSCAEIVFQVYLWVIFFLTYLPRVQGKLLNVGGTFKEHVILLGWVVALLGFKISTFFANKRSN